MSCPVLGIGQKYANERNVILIGDMPIYVGAQSADVWAYQDLFELDAGGAPQYVSGVPPDAFSETGQLWGSPLYDWKVRSPLPRRAPPLLPMVLCKHVCAFGRGLHTGCTGTGGNWSRRAWEAGEVGCVDGLGKNGLRTAETCWEGIQKVDRSRPRETRRRVKCNGSRETHRRRKCSGSRETRRRGKCKMDCGDEGEEARSGRGEGHQNVCLFVLWMEILRGEGGPGRRMRRTGTAGGYSE